MPLHMPSRRMLPTSLAGMAVVSMLFAAGCAEAPVAERRAEPTPDQGMRLALMQERAKAFAFVEALAARCWLDGVVGGAAMIVDRGAERLIIAGDTEELLEADLVPGSDPAIVQITGRAVTNPRLQAQLRSTLAVAERTGETSCPPLQG